MGRREEVVSRPSLSFVPPQAPAFLTASAELSRFRSPTQATERYIRVRVGVRVRVRVRVRDSSGQTGNRPSSRLNLESTNPNLHRHRGA